MFASIHRQEVTRCERFSGLTTLRSTTTTDRYLLSAHLGPGILYVIDMSANRLMKAIPGVPEITGLEYVPGLRKVYTSDRGETKVGVVSLDEMRASSAFPSVRSRTAARTQSRSGNCTCPRMAMKKM